MCVHCRHVGYSLVVILSYIFFQYANVSRYAENFKKSKFMVVHGTGDGKPCTCISCKQVREMSTLLHPTFI